jgi:sterol desaturase/sphingolipid hydroxylase (fatty acid hydroxylase superfamily)
MISLFFAKAVHLLGIRLFQFAAVAAVFIPLERLIPFHPKQRLFRRQFLIDLLHYFVGGLFIIVFVRVTYAVMPMVASWTHLPPSPITVKNLPWWEQVLLFEAGWTFLGYWLHRYEHVNPVLWRLHSIHESTEELDWLSAFRLHPFEPALFQILTVVPLWYLGMSMPVALWYRIYSYIFAHVQHSNVVFPIGPLKYVFPTPEFHRWHHARVMDANGKQVRSFRNFAEYPIWDILFGTFYLPKERPVAYGNARNVPVDYLAQLAYPFRAHDRVLAWKQSMMDRLGLPDRMANIRRKIGPAHEAFENRLARLCLLRTEEPSMAPPPMIPMQPMLGKEEA